MRARNLNEATTADEVQALVAAGHDVNDGFFGCPLYEAAWSGRIEVCNALLKHGADPNKRNGGDVPLHALAMSVDDDRCFPICQALVDAGADVDARDNRGWTPVHLAIQKQNSEALFALIEAGADFHTAGQVFVREVRSDEYLDETYYSQQPTGAPGEELRVVEAPIDYAKHFDMEDILLRTIAEVQAAKLSSSADEACRWSPGDLSGDHLIPKTQGECQAPVQRQARRL